MEKWVIIGSGGFVEGSVLPNFKSPIGGLIARNPLTAKGLAVANNLRVYDDLDTAKSDGCTHAYICSPNWTHLEWIEKCLKSGIIAVCEKPVITKEEDFDKLEILPEKGWYSAMIKRSHSRLEEYKNSRKIVFEILSKSKDSLDFLDYRRGSFLFVELIHAIDISRALLKVDMPNVKVKGNRIKGEIYMSGNAKQVQIKYDFDSDIEKNPLKFEPGLIGDLSLMREKVLLNKEETLKLYRLLFKVDSLMRLEMQL